MKFNQKTRPWKQDSKKFYKKLELRAKNALKIKNQQSWLDTQLILEAARLEYEEIPLEEMYKHFKIVYHEEEQNSKFLLDSELKKMGLLVLRVKQEKGDIVYIYLQKGYSLVF